MGPWSFPIVAEARMAERLLEAERARLARTAAAERRSQGRRDEPQASRGMGRMSRRRRLVTIGVTLVACLALGGPVVVGDEVAVSSVVPVHPPFPIVMTPALVSGEWVCLSGGWCEARLSDPRASGGGLSFDAAVSSPEGGHVTGTFTLAGPDGVWVGLVAATWDDRAGGSELFTGAGQVLGVDGIFALQGTEAYDGWAFVGAWSDSMSGEPAQVSGVIYEGRPLDIDDLLPARAVGPSADVLASDGFVDQALALGGPDRGPAPAPEQGALPADLCGLPLFGWPFGPTASSVGVSIPILPYLAIAACPMP